MGGKNFSNHDTKFRSDEMVDRFDNGKTPHIQSEKINWKKILVIYNTEKGLISPIYKQFLQIIKKNRMIQ